MASGRGVEIHRSTFGEFVEQQWLPRLTEDERLKDTTKATYRNAAKHLCAHIGSVQLMDVSGRDLDDVDAALRAAGRSLSLRRQVHVAASKMLGDALRWRLVAYNAADDATAPAQARPAPRSWTPTEVSRFLAEASSDRFAAFWRLAATTGMRRGELCGLTWQALDLDRSVLCVERNRTTVGHRVIESTPKSGRVRVLSLDPETVRSLRQHRASQAEELMLLGDLRPTHGYVFTWEDGSPVHPQVMTRRFRGLADRAGLPPLRLHNLRHAWATNALAAGVDIGDVSRRLGHASIRTTFDIYTAPSSERDALAANAVARLYG